MSDYTTINIKPDVEKAIKDLGQLSGMLNKKGINRATVFAINETISLGKTEAKRAIKQVYTIADMAIPKALGLDKATAYPHAGKAVMNTYLTGAIIASSTPIPANFFKLKFSYQSGSTSTISKRGVQKTKLNTRGKFGGGVTFEALRGVVEVYQHAFLLPTMSGRVFARGDYKGGGDYGFVQRLGKGSRRTYGPTGNDSVTPLIGVSIHGAAINPKTQKIISNYIQPLFAGKMVQKLDYILGQMLL